MSKPTSKKPRTVRYSSIVFSAFVVPTIPYLTGAVGDPDGAGYVSGKYVGLDNPKEDIKARFRLVSAAANQLYGLATTTRDDPSVLHVLMLPEFFFRGKSGAYESSPDHALVHYVKGLLEELADEPRFANWMFVFGTVLHSDLALLVGDARKKAKQRDDLTQAIVRAYKSAALDDDDKTKDFIFDLLTRTTDFAQKHPLVMVRNSCFVYKQNSSEWPDGLVVDKRFISHEDFVISYYSPDSYSEMNVAYPYDETSHEPHEVKKEPYDARSIFTIDGVTFALEICLDHRRARIRTARKDGDEETRAAAIDVQLIPSCGMQIQQPSVIARTGGLVFNCDGQYSKRDVKASPNDEKSIWTGSQDGKGHSQMSFVADEASSSGGTESKDAKLERPKDVEVVTAPLDVPLDMNVSQTEAYGAGEVHLYSAFPLP